MQIFKCLTIMRGGFAAHTGGGRGKKVNKAEWTTMKKIHKRYF